MTQQHKKISENITSITAANSVSGNNTVQLKDNRELSVVQRKLSEKAASQNFSSVPIQRMFKFEGTTFTENAAYGISDDNTNELFASKESPSPIPTNFFQLDGEKPLDYALRNPANAEEGKLSKAFNKYIPKAEFTKEKPEGFKGINDCGAYANALNADSTESWDAHKASEAFKHPDVADYQPKGIGGADQDATISASPGQTYVIQWQGPKEEGKAAHHAATTVAKDGIDHVTSEAHVGKPELKKPEFHMYGSGENSFYNKHKDYFTKEGGESPYMAIIGSKKIIKKSSEILIDRKHYE